MDKLLKGVTENGFLSVTLIEETKVVNTAIKLHNLNPLTAAALGRTLIASTFMASELKSESDRLSVTVAGDGVGGKVIVSAGSDLKVRGYIENPDAELPLKQNGKLDVASLIGNGRITVVRSTGLKGSYTGTSKIISGELAEDFAYYYAVSEQQPTAMALGVKTSAGGVCLGAGGVIIQALPGATDEILTRAENKIAEFSNISELIRIHGIDGVKEKYFSDVTFDERIPEYECICSKEYIDSIIISLGKSEAEDILKEQGKIEIKCEYCNKKYVYGKKDTEELFRSKNG